MAYEAGMGRLYSCYRTLKGAHAASVPLKNKLKKPA